MKKVIFLLIIFFVPVQNYIRAEEPIKVQVAPPNIASFNKFIDNPVNIYNGTPDVSLNLYTLKDGSIEIPITLRYNTSGIKVDEEAGLVGLGWNLNVGGQIYQNVVGLYDYDNNLSAYKRFMKLPALSHFRDRPTENGFCYLNYNKDVHQEIYPYFYGTVAPFGRLEPDVFYFSYPGNSGKFIIDYRTNEPFILKREQAIAINIKDNEEGYINGFEITTQDGIKHVFNRAYTQMGYKVASGVTYALEKTIYPNGQVILYNYISNRYSKSIKNESLTFYEEKPLYNNQGLLIYGHTPIYNESFSGVDCYDLILKEIKTENYLITFNTDSVIQHVPMLKENMRYLLKNIKIKSSVSTDDKNKKEFSLIYDTGINSLKSFLSKIKEVTENGTIQLYDFSYIGSPPNDLDGKDYWGYANGFYSNLYNRGTDLPDLSKLYAFSSDFHEIRRAYMYNLNKSSVYIRKVDRSPSFEKAQQGMLKSITYPTGGYAEFDYEMNTFNKMGAKTWFVSDKIPIAEVGSVTREMGYYIYNPKDKTGDIGMDQALKGFASASHSYRPYGSYSPESEPFKINKDDTYSELRVTVGRGSLPGEYVICPGDPWEHNLLPACESIYRVEVTLLKKDTTGSFSLFRQYRFRSGMGEEKTSEEKEVWTLDEGEYKLHVRFPDYNNQYMYNVKDGVNEDYGYIEANISWDKSNVGDKDEIEIPKYSTGCGLRIKTIKRYEKKGDEKSLLRTDYEYSDGMLHSIIDFTTKIWVLEAYQPEDISTIPIFTNGMRGVTRFQHTIYNNNIASSPYNSNSGVGYSTVKEIRTGGENIGFTIYKYNNLEGFYKYNIGGVVIDNPINGTLKEVLNYNSKNELIKNNTYNYSIRKTNEYWGLNIVDAFNAKEYLHKVGHRSEVYYSYKKQDFDGIMESGYENTHGDRYHIYKYALDSYALTLDSKETTIDGIKVKEEFTYDPNTLQVKTHKTIENASNVREIKYSYPSDYTCGIYSEMQKRNIISPVIEQRQFKNNLYMGGALVEYGYNNDNTIIVPKKYSLARIQNPLNDPQTFSCTAINKLIYPFTDINYDAFDTRGNLLQLTTKDGIVKSYLWSYSGQYPIAEIVNASYEDVKSHIDVESLSSRYILTDSDIENLNALRGKLPNAQITTYTYKPLVGMLTATDPRGITTYYDYDDFGRLKRTYIQEGEVQKTIETYKYHYRNQQD